MRLPKTIPIYGDTAYRGPCNSESADQKACFGWLKEWYAPYFTLALHPKNEGPRKHRQTSFDKMQGSINTGASDIIIPCAVPFVCELKRANHTKSSIIRDQLAYLESAEKMGAFACIALGFEGFKLAFDVYFSRFGVDR